MATTRSRWTPPLTLPMALFFGGAVLAALLSYQPGRAYGWLFFLAVHGCAYLAITWYARTPERLARAAGATVIYATLVALAIILQYRHLTWIDEFGPATLIGRLLSAPFPFVINLWLPANAAAALFEGPLFVAAGLALDARGKQRIGWAACAALLLLGVFLTASRGAWLALALTTLVGGVAALRMRSGALARRLALIAVVAAALIAAAAALVLILVPGAVESLLFRAADRSELYRNSFYLALDVPFTGIGGGTAFALAYSRMQLLIQVPFLTYPHSLLLAVWLWHGLLGLVGFLALGAAAFRLVLRALPKLGMGGLGAALGGLVVLLHGLTDAPQYDKALVMLSSTMVFAVLVAAALVADPRPLQWIRLGRRGWAIFGVASLGALVLAGPGLASYAAANAAWASYAPALLDAEPDPSAAASRVAAARAWTERGLALNPRGVAALKARGLIELGNEEYATAIAAFERAILAQPGDQAILKGLGYAYIWYGYIDQGALLLSQIERSDEAYGELQAWQTAWRERGRSDLEQRAQAAVEAIDRLRAGATGAP